MNSQKRPSVGVIIGGAHSFFPREMIRGISQQAEKEDVNIFFFLRLHTRQFLQSILRGLASNAYDYQFNTLHDYCQLGGMDGLLLGYGTIGFHLPKNDAVQFARKYSNIPLLIITEKIDAPNCYSIIADNFHGMMDIVDHLITEHNCRKILFVRGPVQNTDAGERLEGYLAAMSKHGLPIQKDMIALGDFSAYSEAAVAQLLDAHPDADAIVFSNDEMAIGGYRVLKDRGIRIGKDIMVTGFDGTDFSETMDPPLTTVFQDAAGMSRRSLIDLMRILDGEDIRETRYPVSMIARESCGCTICTNTSAKEPTDTAAEQKKLKDEINHLQLELTKYQGKSWFLPMMARELNEITEDDTHFCRVILEKLQILGARSAHIFLLDKPMDYDGSADWECPDNLYLAAGMNEKGIAAYPTYDRPKVTREHGIAQLVDDGAKRQYYVFLLFSGERQYGLMVCDIPREEMSFFYVTSLQLGLSFRHFELSRMERMRHRQLAKDMQQMEARNRELDILSAYDELTGLLNLRGLNEQIRQMIQSGKLQKGYVVYCDLDHLKEINDSFGHTEGNYAIRTCARILESCVRGNDILARIGGDEFICYIPTDFGDFPDIFRQRLKNALAKINAQSHKPFYTDMSVGIAHFDSASRSSLEKASAEADRKLYEAKKLRRSSVQRTE